MEIYLMRHGPSFSPDQDPDEGLTPQGRQIAQSAARALARLGLTLDALVASPKTRARQTAALAAAALGLPESQIMHTDLVKPMAPPAQALEFLAGLGDLRRIMVVTHMPFLPGLASLLLTGGPGATVVFEGAGVCRIDADALPTRAGRLVWCLPPAVTGLLAA